MANTKIQSEQIEDDIALGGNPTTTTQSAGNNTTRVATTAFVTTAVANLVDSAPSALDTLNELAAAMGDDASFSTTITNSIATKLPLAGGTLTGDVTLNKTSGDALFKIVTGGGNDAILELDAPGASGAQSFIKFSDSGTLAGSIIYTHNSGGTDFMTFGTGGNNTTALTLDSSQNATFAGNITSSGSLTVDVAGSIKLDADSGEIDLQDGGTDFGQFAKSSNDFRINHSIQDGRFVFRGNDGGSIISALTLDIANAGDATFNRAVTATEVRPSSNLVMNSADNQVIYLGAGNDFLISHDGSNNILNSANNHSLRVAFGGTNQWEFHSSSYMKGNDGKKVILGDSSDLQIYHDGSNSYIDNTQSGQALYIRDSNAIVLRNYSATENMIHCAANGAVNLYYDGSSKLTTASGGVEITGSIFIGGTGSANEFSDYEEGTHTTAFTASTSGTISISPSTMAYTKVGRLVTCTGYFAVSSVSSPIGLLFISLPFTIASGNEFSTSASVSFNSLGSGKTYEAWPIAVNGTDKLRIYIGASTSVSASFAQTMAAGTDVRISFSYMTT